MSSSQQVVLANWKSWHGFKGDKKWKTPICVATSDKASRADQKNLIKANEFIDEPEVLEQKIDAIVELIKSSKNCITYTGAGLSKASGIPDYASKAENSVVGIASLKNPIDALPTYAHHTLVALERKGYLKHWIQQNHDGLPQKAGYPQEKINEIHGAWFDPSNPVVPMSGSLRTDLFQAMLEWEQQTDLCLCLGTSLSGMNADRMASTVAKKAKKGNALGLIIINLQQTPMDMDCSIRVWAKLDDALSMLAKKLDLDVETTRHIFKFDSEVFQVPYDENGNYDPRSLMTLDMREDAKVKIVAVGAINEGAEGEIYGRKPDGTYQLRLTEKEPKRGGIFNVSRLCGPWFVESAIRGTLASLPFTNVDPQIKKLDKDFEPPRRSAMPDISSLSIADRRD